MINFLFYFDFVLHSIAVQFYKLSHLTNQNPTLPTYVSQKVPIKEQKFSDIRSLLPYIPREFMDFYQELKSGRGKENKCHFKEQQVYLMKS